MISMAEMKPPEPKHLYREEVIDDFIRNFLKKYNMTETLNIFQEEWHMLFKKGAFHDNELGQFTDIHNKNIRLAEKLELMRKEVDAAKAKADKEKKNWEQLRKERDFHITHYNRVEQEKKELYEQIKMLKDKHQLFEQSIDELNKKYELTMKQKILIKLDKDAKQRQLDGLRNEIKGLEQTLTKGAGDKAKISEKFKGEKVIVVEQGKPTPWPEDARTNPYRGKNFDEFNHEMACSKTIPVSLMQHKTNQAHEKSIASIALHPTKSIVATASDDGTWKVWNLATGEKLISVEGHNDWIGGVDFHPSGSHLAMCGGDCTVKVWDFVNSCYSHVFKEHKQPVWSVKFHDTGHFVLTACMDSTMKLFDINSQKCRQTFYGHTDSVNKISFDPYTNFFASCSSDKTVSIWDMRSGLTVQTFYGHATSINDVAYSHRGKYVASGDADGIVKIWDTESVKEYFMVDLGEKSVHSLAFDINDAFVLAGCSDGTIEMQGLESIQKYSINIEERKVAHQATGHEKTVSGVVVSHKNLEAYTVGSDKTIRIWKQSHIHNYLSFKHNNSYCIQHFTESTIVIRTSQYFYSHSYNSSKRYSSPSSRQFQIRVPIFLPPRLRF
eukprot:TRINITY_DN120489_c0_g1_i1.p1 TRINITY_DN120489_c0_g1~~TRINITY_DN120489_c0_g1_i1.p1  ORF type:complete len:610 (-),score=78.81 TRINITY_DN120489_c0_g1_i1:2913-4742(-)